VQDFKERLTYYEKVRIPNYIIEKIPLIASQISENPYMSSQKCLSAVCHLLAKITLRAILVQSTHDRGMKRRVSPSLLAPPFFVFFRLFPEFICEPLTLICSFSYLKVIIYAASISSYLKAPAEFWPRYQFNHRRRPAPMACREKREEFHWSLKMRVDCQCRTCFYGLPLPFIFIRRTCISRFKLYNL
jgi:hypothetical protein